MLIYYCSVFACFFATFLKDKRLKLFILLGLLIFLCGGYMCGSDWRNYEYAYNHSRIATAGDEQFEIGYSYLQAYAHSLGIDFWHFHILLKFLVFLSLCYFVRFFKQSLFLFWFLFLPDMGFYLFIDCPFRNLLAAGGFFLGIRFFLERRILLFFLLIFLLSLLHSSAYFLVIVYMCTKIHLKNKYYVLLFLVSNILAYRLDLITDYILFPLLGVDGHLGERVRFYFIQEEFWSTSVNLGTIYRIVCFCIILYYRKKVEDSSTYGHYIFNLTMLFFMIYPFGISMKMIQRFMFYTMPFFIISVEIIFRDIRLLSMPFSKKMLFMIFFFWGMIKIYTNTSYDYRYIPYTNYLEYIENPPAYSFRSNYNIQNSPYEAN